MEQVARLMLVCPVLIGDIDGLCLCLQFRHIGTAFGLDLDKLPRRWLPPGHVMDLYRHYAVSVHEEERATLLGTDCCLDLAVTIACGPSCVASGTICS